MRLLTPRCESALSACVVAVASNCWRIERLVRIRVVLCIGSRFVNEIFVRSAIIVVVTIVSQWLHSLPHLVYPWSVCVVLRRDGLTHGANITVNVARLSKADGPASLGVAVFVLHLGQEQTLFVLHKWRGPLGFSLGGFEFEGTGHRYPRTLATRRRHHVLDDFFLEGCTGEFRFRGRIRGRIRGGYGIDVSVRIITSRLTLNRVDVLCRAERRGI
mmetsp:Transcript_17235/g.35565  ORF Transcript_17235/g.35565 Transcript_17235/m.35565 type:complete len:216 (-) Transcript_17235:11-658(-)